MKFIMTALTIAVLATLMNAPNVEAAPAIKPHFLASLRSGYRPIPVHHHTMTFDDHN